MATDRRIAGLTPRSEPGAGEPTGLGRLMRHNRPVAAAPDPIPGEPQPETAPTTGPAADPDTPQAANPTGEPPKVKLTVTAASDVVARAKGAYRATNHLEDDTSWSEFVEKALLAETERRENMHNDGQAYAGHHTNLRPGRPVR